MTGFEPQTSGIGCDHSSNWATTTARVFILKWSIPCTFVYKLAYPAYFCLFSSFSNYNFNNINEKSIDGVLEIWTRGCMIVGADNTTELWRPPEPAILSMFVLL